MAMMRLWGRCFIERWWRYKPSYILGRIKDNIRMWMSEKGWPYIYILVDHEKEFFSEQVYSLHFCSLKAYETKKRAKSQGISLKTIQFRIGKENPLQGFFD